MLIMFFRKFSILLFILSMMVLPITHAADLQKVDINTANAQTLARVLTGIGPKKAAAIVDFRKKHGPFKSISDLDKVYGIGKKTIAKNQNKIIISTRKVSTKPSTSTRKSDKK
jgi:competence protein ComEA